MSPGNASALDAGGVREYTSSSFDGNAGLAIGAQKAQHLYGEYKNEGAKK
jgi:hypothetical protein